jgi:radical SAM protein with 4Fe4S-binding SPASM domain
MSYRLSEQYALRGWEDMPHALRDLKSGKALALDEDTFQTLSLCNGVMDMDDFLIPDGFRKRAVAFAEREIVTPCETERPLSPVQKYRMHPCHSVKMANWSITGRCNMNCRHCFMSAPQAKYGEPSHDRCLDIIRQLGEAGVPAVGLTGGEPLVRDDFLELVDALLEQNVCVSEINTNGLLVDEALLDELSGRGVRSEFALSFDGIGHHDWMRGMDGAEQMVIDKIRLLRSRGFPVSIKSNFHRNSVSSMYETMMLLAELDVSLWVITPLLNAGNWLNEDDSLKLSAEEFIDVNLELIARYFEEGSPISMKIRRYFACAKGSRVYTMPFKRPRGESEPICLAARNSMYIAPDCKLLPCLALSGMSIWDDTPNLRDTTIAQMLSDSPYLDRITTPVSAFIEHNPGCHSCEHLPVCDGGCRASALALNGDDDYLGRNPLSCYIFKSGYEDRLRDIAERHFPLKS